MKKPTFQAGVDGGIGQTTPGATNVGPGGEQQASNTSEVLRAYALARNPWLGVEAGYMKLPELNARVNIRDYPSYKFAAEGRLSADMPRNAQGSQDITATAPYGRLNVYGPTVSGVEPYGFYGKAKVRTDNHEKASYNDGQSQAEHREILKKTSKYYGAGLQAQLAKNLVLRAEYGRIPNSVDEYHTNKRDISMGLLGLGYQW